MDIAYVPGYGQWALITRETGLYRRSGVQPQNMISWPPARVLKWVLQGKSPGIHVTALVRCTAMPGSQRAREVPSYKVPPGAIRIGECFPGLVNPVVHI